jgi:protein-S-isoprenylcysteine O-methyltransferase Ste14
MFKYGTPVQQPGTWRRGGIYRAFVVAVHHAIVLAEENHMQKVFSREYVEYCSHVRRYV